MPIQPINITQIPKENPSLRPNTFADFVGQDDTKKILQAAIKSAQTTDTALGHTLFSGQSGYGKTTLAHIVAESMGSQIHIITGYALSKPADIISLLNTLGPKDILFIDEIHRIKPQIEEVLYIAMEDYRIDMMIPDGSPINIPLQPFTLIGATTMLEKLSTPLKNRYIYNFHFQSYTDSQRSKIIARYLQKNKILRDNPDILSYISQYIPHAPREIATSCIQLRDYLIAHDIQQKEQDTLITQDIWDNFRKRSKRDKGGLTQLHQQYLDILRSAKSLPVGLKTLAVKLGMSELSVETDIEPLLFKLGKIEKTKRGRILL